MASSKSTIRNVKRGLQVDIEKATKQATEISNELPCACMQISEFFPDVKDLELGSIEPASVSGGKTTEDRAMTVHDMGLSRAHLICTPRSKLVKAAREL